MESLLSSIAIKLGLPGMAIVGSIFVGACEVKHNSKNSKDISVLQNEMTNINKKLDLLLDIALKGKNK